MAWMAPGEMAMFGLDDREQAKQWAAGSESDEGCGT